MSQNTSRYPTRAFYIHTHRQENHEQEAAIEGDSSEVEVNFWMATLSESIIN